jgi:hypothetical protein
VQVLSPVGTFPLRIKRPHMRDGSLSIDAALGAWRSEVRLERGDLPLAAAVTGILVFAFALGRLSASRSSGARK